MIIKKKKQFKNSINIITDFVHFQLRTIENKFNSSILFKSMASFMFIHG